MPHISYNPRPRPSTLSSLAPLASQTPRSGIPDIADLPATPRQPDKPPVARQVPETASRTVRMGLSRLSIAKHTVTPEQIAKGLGLELK